jgi:hypothetical protein
MTIGLADTAIIVVNSLANLTGERASLFTSEGVVVLEPEHTALCLEYTRQSRVASVHADVRPTSDDGEKIRALLIAEPFSTSNSKPARQTASVQVFSPPSATGFASPAPVVPPTACGILVTPDVAVALERFGFPTDDAKDDEEEEETKRPLKRRRRALGVYGMNYRDCGAPNIAASLIRYPFTV